MNNFYKFGKWGLLAAQEVRNHRPAVHALERAGHVQKVYKKGRVFYEVTKQGLSLLDLYRNQLVNEALFGKILHPRSFFFQALLSDLRFLDINDPRAEKFLFLGDWRLTKKPVFSQLKLAQFRYYQARGLAWKIRPDSRRSRVPSF